MRLLVSCKAEKLDDGKYALLSAGTSDNGICKFINKGDEKSEMFDNNNISIDMFGKVYFHEYKFYSVSHGRIIILTPKEKYKRYTGLFIAEAIENSSRGKFSYAQMCSAKKAF